MNRAVGILLIWNAIVFLAYGVDKFKAKYNRWRISENALILSAFLMGGIGTAFGLVVFRHKTKHIKLKFCCRLRFSLIYLSSGFY